MYKNIVENFGANTCDTKYANDETLKNACNSGYNSESYGWCSTTYGCSCVNPASSACKDGFNMK